MIAAALSLLAATTAAAPASTDYPMDTVPAAFATACSGVENAAVNQASVAGGRGHAQVFMEPGPQARPHENGIFFISPGATPLPGFETSGLTLVASVVEL